MKAYASISLGLLVQNDCQAWVQLFNVLRNSTCFKAGLPQGSILAPLLFLFSIKTHADNLSDETIIAMLADDVSILTTAKNKTDTECATETEVDRFSNGVSQESYNWTLRRGKWVPSLLGQMTANGFQI